MALLTRDELLGTPAHERVERIKMAVARTTLLKEALATPLDTTFDVFLSHSTKHAAEVISIKRKFERIGISVYVDWVEDQELNRSDVTPASADRLRRRISASRSLLVHASEGAAVSRWVPWELGFADGVGLPVGILPVVAGSRVTVVYKGVEYLGLYPYVDFADDTRGVHRAWTRRSRKRYVRFDSWLKGKQPTLHE
jgi:hypothetical protein